MKSKNIREGGFASLSNHFFSFKVENENVLQLKNAVFFKVRGNAVSDSFFNLRSSDHDQVSSYDTEDLPPICKSGDGGGLELIDK
eukprot:UN15500